MTTLDRVFDFFVMSRHSDMPEQLSCAAEPDQRWFVTVKFDRRGSAAPAVRPAAPGPERQHCADQALIAVDMPL
ncbi:hypothetical protein ABZS95_43470 [Streptomyces sp. NPDC005479]|uniref:hypothetical protein n=1 Tax=unclassified Streptomyces TaxID=2593676 RepID=UPI0033BBDE1F